MAKLGSGGLNDATQFFNSFVPELWSEGVRYYFQRNMVFGGLATDWSDVVAGGGDIVNIPRINEQSSSDKTQGGVIGWTHNTTDESKDQLIIDTHKYSGLLVEDVASVQASDDLMAKYSSELGYALGKSIDDSLEAVLGAGGNTIELGQTTGADEFSKADFATIVQTLLDSDINYLNGDVYMVLKPSLYASLFKLDDFARADVIGDSFNYPRVSGFVGSLVGIPVYVSSAVDTSGVFGYVFHKSALNIAYSQAPRLQEQYDIDYLGTKVVADTIYGCKLITGTSTANTKRAWSIKNAS